MLVIDFAKQQMVYRTPSLIFTDEARECDIQRPSANPYWSLIVEDDLKMMLEARDAYLQLMESLSMEQRLRHKGIYHCTKIHTPRFGPRWGTKDGTVLHHPFHA